MKILILSFIFTSTIFSCQKKVGNEENIAIKKVDKFADAQSANIQTNSLETKGLEIFAKDLSEIQILIRKTYVWLDLMSMNPSKVEENPITNEKGNLYAGFDLKQHSENLSKLKNSGFFTDGFLDNYSKILLKQNEILKTNKTEWLVGDMAPFSAMQAVQWCDCQDVPYDNPNPWNLLQLEAINLENGEFKWTWGEVNSKYSIDWKNQSYKFKVAKENGKLKISYLEGFNYQKSIKFDN